MLFPLVHLLFAAAVALTVVLRRRRPGHWMMRIARLACAGAGLVGVVVGTAVFAWTVGGADESWPGVLLALLVATWLGIGGVLLFAGAVPWHGERAAALRRAGLVLAGLGAFVPSTISLLLLLLIAVLPAMWPVAVGGRTPGGPTHRIPAAPAA